LILAQHIDLLSGALATNSRLATCFLKDPLAAIQEYNADFAERYHQPAIELTEEECQLVLALPKKAHNVLEIYECLAEVLEKQKVAATAYAKLTQADVAATAIDIGTATASEDNTSAA
jgi:hypothetical protein